MKKKLILPVGLLTLSLIGLASCGGKHEHSYGSSWEKDGTHHWHECEGEDCSEISGKAEHTGGTATETEKAKCEVCGESYGSLKAHEHAYTVSKVDAKYLVSAADCDSKAVYKKSCACGEAGTETFESGEALGHDYAEEWTNDETHHWHECVREGCEATSEKVAHSGGTATEEAKAKCEVCEKEYGSVLPHEHVYSQEVVDAEYLVSEADCDSKAVYKKSCACGEAGTETFETGEVLGHSYDTPKSNETHHWDECDCGAKDNEEAHDYTEAKKDDTHHWNECECGAIDAKVEHTYVADKDDTHHWEECACGSEINKEAHEHNLSKDENNHWEECSCGDKGEEETHEYSIPNKDETHHWNECECGAIGEKEAHNYSRNILDELHHWEECDCGAKSNVETHDYKNSTSDETHHWNHCDCGAIDEMVGHDYTVPNSDETHHWNECECGAIEEKVEHTYVADKDETHHWEECACGSEINKESHELKESYVCKEGKLYHVSACDCEYVIEEEVEETEVAVDNETDLRAAIEAGKTVVLGANIDVSKSVKVKTTATVELNGYTLTSKDDPLGDGIFVVYPTGNLTINGEGTLNSCGANEKSIAIWVYGGKATLNGGTYTNVGATSTYDKEHFDLIYVSHGGEITINRGTYIDEKPKWTLNHLDKEPGTITVNGGKFYDFNPSKPDTGANDKTVLGEGLCAQQNSEKFYVVAAHIEVETEGKAATCTEKGLTEGKHCSRCETILVEQEEIAIDPDNHVYECVYDDTHHWEDCKCGNAEQTEKTIHTYVPGTVVSNKKVDTCVCGATSITSIWDGSIATSIANGTGTEADPYVINTCSELAFVAQEVSAKVGTYYKAHYKLANHLDLNNKAWTPIGVETLTFQGIFDGNGKTIIGLNVNQTENQAALFAFASNATFKNMDVTGTIVGGGTNNAILVARASAITITNCIVRGSVTGTGANTAGFVGIINAGGSGTKTIINACTNYATVKGTGTSSTGSAAAGIAGYINAAVIEITNCKNYGSISYANHYSGGIIGRALKAEGAYLKNCYNFGDITQYDTTNTVTTSAGIIGDTAIKVENCYTYEKALINGYSINNGTALLYPASMGTNLNKKGAICSFLRPAANCTSDAGFVNCGVCDENGNVILTGNVDVWDGSIATSFANGTGSETDPYQISSAKELAFLAQQVNANNATYISAHYKLMNNIHLNNKAWTPISTSRTIPFKGTFDGNNKAIIGLSATRAGEVGLFGHIADAHIKNVTVIGNITSTGSNNAILVARAQPSTIENCVVRGSVVSSTTGYSAGLVGTINKYVDNTSGKMIVTNCVNYADVTAGADYVGGISATQGTLMEMSGCSNYGNITTSKGKIGGIVGNTVASTGSYIKNCTNYGDVTSTSSATTTGGIVGVKAITVENCIVDANAKINGVANNS